MQGRNKTNQPRHEFEDLNEGVDDSRELLGEAAGDAGAGQERTSRAGGRNSDRPGNPNVQAAVRPRGAEASGNGARGNPSRGNNRRGTDANGGNDPQRVSTRRVDTLPARNRDDDVIDLRSPADGLDESGGRFSDLVGRGSSLLGGLRERGAGWLEQLRSASGGMIGNRLIGTSTQGSEGHDVELGGKRIAVLAADGVEKVELTVPVKALQSAGAQVDIVSLRPGRIRSVNLHEPAARIRVDCTILEADPDDYDGLLIPGGLIGPDLLRQSSDAREFVQAFDAAGKPIASICHGVWLLSSADLTKGRLMTSWPGVRDDMVNAGATWLDEEVVRDGNWVTSRSPKDLKAFVPAMLSLFAEEGDFERATDRAGKALKNVDSAPQHAEPPQMMLDVMKRMPRPSMRTAAMLGVLGAAVLASRAMRR